MKTSVLWGRRTAAAVAAAATIGAMGLIGSGAAFADTGCQTAGDSGFTAAVVAQPGQVISQRTVNATGCDVGIYVDAANVTIDQVKVTGANAAGILAENTSYLTLTRSTVTGNGFHAPAAPYPPGTPPVTGQLDQAFAISLFGVSHATVGRNTVYNNGRGGIGIMDNGPFDPGRVVGLPTYPAPIPVSDVTVSQNTLWANYAGCGIVVSAFNSGNTVDDVTVTQNTIRGTMQPGDVGGIVAQSNGPSSVVSNIMISRNTVTDSGESGVIVHAAAPGSMTKNVTVTRNLLSGNNWMAGTTIGVEVDSRMTDPYLGQQNVNTVITRNTISDQFYGIWAQGPDSPLVSRNDITTTTGGQDILILK
ncbi:hypothetical protein GCM10022240_07570 [Microbacterium kribbense]|uniref:Right handed beta helix domain-containing protein n=1 Tax=Microbacterium kribbense TaxID=433645 RepID=A0ABP7GAJ3_9MICO